MASLFFYSGKVIPQVTSQHVSNALMSESSARSRAAEPLHSQFRRRNGHSLSGDGTSQAASVYATPLLRSWPVQRVKTGSLAEPE
jgi:hypothetical protein